MDIETSKKMVDAVDLTPVFDRLVTIELWKTSDARDAMGQYRHYLLLRKHYPQYELPPSPDIEAVWHAHIVQTKQYQDFCETFFGKYLDHTPSIMLDEKARKMHYQLLNKTCELYYQEFGIPLYQITGYSWLERLLINCGLKKRTSYGGKHRL